jgi:hypothetical protein
MCTASRNSLGADDGRHVQEVHLPLARVCRVDADLATVAAPARVEVATQLAFCAHGVLAAAAELGVAVPSALSVIGFDDIIAPYTSPPLCSYGPPPIALSMAAVDQRALLLAGSPVEPVRTVLSPELVCRGSCSAPP